MMSLRYVPEHQPACGWCEGGGCRTQLQVKTQAALFCREKNKKTKEEVKKKERKKRRLEWSRSCPGASRVSLQVSRWQLGGLRASRASAGRPRCRCRSGSGGGGGRCRSRPSHGPAAGGGGETLRGGAQLLVKFSFICKLVPLVNSGLQTCFIFLLWVHLMCKIVFGSSSFLSVDCTRLHRFTL